MEPRQVLKLVIEALNKTKTTYRGCYNDFQIYNKEDFIHDGVQMIPEGGLEPEGYIRIWLDDQLEDFVEIEDSLEGVQEFISRASEADARDGFKNGQKVLKAAYRDMLGITGSGVITE